MADTITTWDDFKDLINDPNISKGIKKELIKSVAADVPGSAVAAPGPAIGTGPRSPKDSLDGFSQDDLDKFKDDYQVTDEQIDQYYNGKGDSFSDVVADAQEAQDASGKQSQWATDSQGKLDDIKTSADNGDVGGAGAKNSNDIMDQALCALSYITDYLPLYHKVSDSFKASEAAKAVKDDSFLYKRFDEQRDIPFDKWEAASKEISTAATTAHDSSGNMGKKLSPLFDHWTGKASDAAQQTYSTFDKENQANVVDKLNSVAETVMKKQADVAKAVRNKANQTLKIFHAGDPNNSNAMLAGKSRDDWSVTVDIANGAEDKDTLLRAAEAWGVNIDTSCSGSLTSETKEAIRKKAQDVTTKHLVGQISGDWADFMKLCDTTKDTVNKDWTAVTNLVGDMPDDPFTPPGGKGGDGKTPSGDEGDGTPPPDVPGDDKNGGTTSPSDTDSEGKVDEPPDPSGGGSSGGGTDGGQSGGGQSDGGQKKSPVPDLSGIGDNMPSPGSGGDSSGGDTGGGQQNSPPPDFTDIGNDVPSPGSGGDTGGGQKQSPVPDLSNIGGNMPSPGSGGGTGDGSTTGGGDSWSPPPVSSTSPESVTPDLSHIGDNMPSPGSGGGSGGGSSWSPPTSKAPDLSNIGQGLPSPSSGGGSSGPGTSTTGDPFGSGGQSNQPGGKHGEPVRKVSLPGGGSATLSKLGDDGNELLTLHQPDGGIKQYALDFDGKTGEDIDIPGVETVQPDADGNMVLHDGDTTLTMQKPDDNGIMPITVDGPDSDPQDFQLAPPGVDTDDLHLEKLDDLPAPDDSGFDSQSLDPASDGDSSVPDLSTSDATGGLASQSFDGAPLYPAPSVGQSGGSADVSPQFEGKGGATPTDPASASGGAPAGEKAPQGGGRGMGMMPPMSGAGQGKGGNSERGQNKWALEGNLFDDQSADRMERLHSFLDGRPRKDKD